LRGAGDNGKVKRQIVDSRPGEFAGVAKSDLFTVAWRQPVMSNEQPIELEGTVSTVLPGTMFRVRLDNEHEVLAHLSGKMRKHFVRLTVGDRVRLEMSPYDLSKARITYRLK
jgi:translation initiation factor IF-1